MKQYYIINIVLSLFIAFLAGSCSKGDDILKESEFFKYDSPIYFNAQYGAMKTELKSDYSRAADQGDTIGLPLSTRFAIKMYYDSGNSSNTSTVFDTEENGYMKITSKSERCTYTDSDYISSNEPENVIKLYWNNRKEHNFVAFFLKGEATTGTPSLADTDSMSFMIKDQKDPMLAITAKIPTSGSNKDNKVNLVFVHQTAYIQVKVKPDNLSIDTGSETITINSIRLLGTAEQIKIYTALNENGEHIPSKASDSVINMLEMKLDSSPASGYLGSASAFAFGTLKGIGITWEESASEVKHVVNYYFKDEDIMALSSGKKYIYSVTLRRGAMNTISVDIIDWLDDDNKDYQADGYINK